jgi:predicted MPP superfamily phosphohydrolase
VRRRFRIVLAIYAAAHLYMWWRLVLPLPSPIWQIATVVLPLAATSFPIASLRTRNLPRHVRRRWLLPGFLWFGFATYLLLGALASHVAVICGTPPLRAAEIAIAGAAAIVVLGLLNVARGPVVKRVTVPIAKLRVPQYVIAHLTDVHIGSLIGKNFAEELVQRVNALRPDLVVITGDLVDGHLHELKPHIEPLRGLRARDGVFAVTGNHEYYWNVEPWLLHLRSLGIQVLRNEHVTIASSLVLAGTDDSSASEDVPRAVAGRDPELPLVLMAHHPRTIRRAMTAGVDLQLSGHTHGGQLLPWGWLARLWDPKLSGLARFGESWLYVSQGTGYWGPPLRIGTSCEIAAITLVPNES